MQRQRVPGQLTLEKASLLYRRWEFQGWDGPHTLEYNGKGMGYESVLIEGQEVCRLPSHSWFVPRFDFEFMGRDTTLLVQVAPLKGTIQFAIWQGNHCLYQDDTRLEPGALKTGVVIDDDGLIDQGTCLIYYRLSYRRRIIRSLWMTLLSPLLLLLILLPGFPPAFPVSLFVFSVVGSLLQAAWNYFIFRNHRR